MEVFLLDYKGWEVVCILRAFLFLSPVRSKESVYMLVRVIFFPTYWFPLFSIFQTLEKMSKDKNFSLLTVKNEFIKMQCSLISMGYPITLVLHTI